MYHDDNEVSFHLLNQANLFSCESVVNFKSQGDTLNIILSSLSWGLTSSGFNPTKLGGRGGGSNGPPLLIYLSSHGNHLYTSPDAPVLLIKFT